MPCTARYWTKKTLCCLLLGTAIVALTNSSSSSGDDTTDQRSITCWCSTAECSAQHVSTCSTPGSCYLQHRREAARSGVLVTRGCMGARASSSLLCMNRPPKLGVMGAGWPSLHCCSRDRCNSLPPPGVMWDLGNETIPTTALGSQTTSVSPLRRRSNDGGFALESSPRLPSLKRTPTRSWMSGASEGAFSSRGPPPSLLDRFGALSPEDLSGRLLKLAGEHQTGPYIGGRGPLHHPYTGSLALVAVLALTAVLVVVTVYWYTREWMRPTTSPCKQWVLRESTRKDWGMRRNMAGGGDNAGKILLV